MPITPESSSRLTQDISNRDLQGSEDVAKLAAPVIAGDPNLQRIVNQIYDDLNRLNAAVNQNLAANRDHTGKIGDIRLVEHPENPKKSVLQGFTKDGWMQFGQSESVVYKGKVVEDTVPPTAKETDEKIIAGKTADYDSGWLDENTSIAIEHNLNTKEFSHIMIMTCGDAGVSDISYWINTSAYGTEYRVETDGNNDVDLLMNTSITSNKVRLKLWK